MPLFTGKQLEQIFDATQLAISQAVQAESARAAQQAAAAAALKQGANCIANRKRRGPR